MSCDCKDLVKIDKLHTKLIKALSVWSRLNAVLCSKSVHLAWTNHTVDMLIAFSNGYSRNNIIVDDNYLIKHFEWVDVLSLRVRNKVILDSQGSIELLLSKPSRD